MHNPKLFHCWVTQCYNKHYILLEHCTNVDLLLISHPHVFFLPYSSDVICFLIKYSFISVLDFLPEMSEVCDISGEDKKRVPHKARLCTEIWLIVLDSWELYRFLSPRRLRSRFRSPILFYSYPPSVMNIFSWSKCIIGTNTPLFPLSIVVNCIYLKP